MNSFACKSIDEYYDDVFQPTSGKRLICKFRNITGLDFQQIWMFQ